MKPIKTFISKNIFFIILFLVSFIFLYYFHYQDGGDDLAFQQASETYSLAEFIHIRYYTWSSRIIPDIFSYLVNGQIKTIWVSLNASIITIFAFLFYKYINLIIPIKKTAQKFISFLSCFSFFFINRGILLPAIIWRTGSTNYLWPTVIGLSCLYPFIYFLTQKKPLKNSIFFIILSLVSGLLSEQISFFLILLSITFIIYLFTSHTKPTPSLIVMIINMFIGSAILFLAPGNHIRYQSEVKNNFPDFDSLSLLNHLSISLYWIINKLINFLSPPLIPIFLILGIRNIKTKKLKIASTLSIVISLCLIIKIIFNLNLPISTITSENILSFSNIFSYSLVSFTFLIIIYLIINDRNTIVKNLSLLFLFISIALMFIITLSPTLDVSGNRTLFLSNVCLNFVWIFLYLKTVTNIIN